MTQARLDCVKPRSLWIEGSATFTIVASRTIISIPAHRTTRASQRESPATGEVREDRAMIRGPSFGVIRFPVSVVMAYSSPQTALEPEDLIDEDDGDAAGCDLAVHDEDLAHAAVNAIRRLGAGIFERKGVFVDASEALLDVRHDLLRPHNADDWPGTTDVRSELTAAH